MLGKPIGPWISPQEETHIVGGGDAFTTDQLTDKNVHPTGIAYQSSSFASIPAIFFNASPNIG